MYRLLLIALTISALLRKRLLHEFAASLPIRRARWFRARKFRPNI
jgi:hypothetical protein